MCIDQGPGLVVIAAPSVAHPPAHPSAKQSGSPLHANTHACLQPAQKKRPRRRGLFLTETGDRLRISRGAPARP